MIKVKQENDLYKVYYDDKFTGVLCVIEDFQDGNIPTFRFNHQDYKLKYENGKVIIWQ